MDPKKAAADIYPKVVSWRRHLHRHPELSWEEHETCAWIMERLREFGLQPRQAAFTGVIAEVKGDLAGPTIALRADIDALAVDEQTGLEFASQRPGVMHACGHDAHAAMLLGAAKILAQHRRELAGTVRLLFQPAEETPPPHVQPPALGGAPAMVEAGAVENAAAVFGIHVFSNMPLNLIDLTAGPVMAGSQGFDVEILGKGGHAGMPAGTVDALAVAAHLVVALRSAATLGVDPLDSLVLHVGTLQAGTARTAVAETARLQGTIRYLEKPVLVNLRKKIEQAAAGVAEAFGAKAEVKFAEFINKPVDNDEKLVAKLGPITAEILGEGYLIRRKPVMGSEDFWAYLDQVPGVFMALGGANTDKHSIEDHHSPHFWFDEECMKTGVELWLRIALAAQSFI